MILTPGHVGHDAGWHLAFFTDPPGDRLPALSIGAGDYHADIHAALPAGLEGGTYSFAIEGITNKHYEVLHQIWSATLGRALYVDLYLYWRDTGGVLGYLGSIAGATAALDRLGGTPPVEQRVARLAVTRLSRRAGNRRYEAVIEARERVFEALAQRLPRPPVTAATAAGLAHGVAEKLGVPAVAHPFLAAPPARETPRHTAAVGRRGTRVLAELEAAITAESRRSGLPMYVIRDGTLHIGPGRSIPLDGGTKPLDAAGGLVHVETTGRTRPDHTAELDDPTALAAPTQLQYSLTLKGRPDLRPGDTVSFPDPFAGGADPAAALDATTTPSSFTDALAGLGDALAGTSALIGGRTTMYVSTVGHRLSRTDGFVTTLAGVAIRPGPAAWTAAPEPGTPAPAQPAATAHDELAGAMQDLVRSLQPDGVAIAEVRAATPSGTAEPPGQTVDVWVGLAGDDGKPFRARRLPVDRERRTRHSGVPTVTPFAWGKCGLVVPRYPGTRVVLAHAGNAADDAVELGALWESGHGPDARPGDWWLILPASVDASFRRALTDEDTPREPAGTATHDLIDADGERTIEVGRLTVRVKPTKLPPPGARPEPAADPAERVTIEHESGSRIVIKDDGDIVITSTRNLTLATKQTLTLEADDVKVKVKNAMDVGDR